MIQEFFRKPYVQLVELFIESDIDERESFFPTITDAINDFEKDLN